MSIERTDPTDHDIQEFNKYVESLNTYVSGNGIASIDEAIVGLVTTVLIQGHAFKPEHQKIMFANGIGSILKAPLPDMDNQSLNQIIDINAAVADGINGAVMYGIENAMQSNPEIGIDPDLVYAQIFKPSLKTEDTPIEQELPVANSNSMPTYSGGMEPDALVTRDETPDDQEDNQPK